MQKTCKAVPILNKIGAAFLTEQEAGMENAGKENFELAMLDDYVVLYTGSRIDRNTVPENLFCYDVRHDDDCQGIACEVKPHVLVNL